MSYCYAPDYRIEIHKPAGYGQPGIVASYALRSLIRADLSLMTAGGVGQASLQFADIAGTIARTVNPQPMDIVRVWLSSRFDATLACIWTGVIDAATPRYDPQYGQSLVIDASSPYKLWEVTKLFVSSPNDPQVVNDAAAFALAMLQGINSKDLLLQSAKQVGFPGPLGSLANPAVFSLSETDLVGQRNWSQPLDDYATPNQQTYSAVIQGLVQDTGFELWFDEFGSLVYRPVAYLHVPGTPRVLLDEDTLEIELSQTDTNVYSQVRVHWYGDGYYPKDDGFAAAPAGLAAQLGTRVYTVNAPWLSNRDSANFLAASLLQQFAAGVAIGTVSKVADPAFRIGSVIQVPSLLQGGGVSYYYVLGKTYTLQWGQPFVETLTLGFGRDPRLSFPYIGTQNTPVLSSGQWPTAGQGIPTGDGGLTYTSSGQLTTPFTLAISAAVPIGDASGPFPVGTVLRLTDTTGNPVGSSANGEYVITSTTSDTTVTIHDAAGSPAGTHTVIVNVVSVASSVSGSTGGAQSGSGQATAGGTPPTDQTGGKGVSTPTTFAFYPIAGAKTLALNQAFGTTTDTGEPFVCGRHFHTGIDIHAAEGTPIRAAVGGTVVSAGWDTTGYGNLTVIETGTLRLYYAHQSQFNVPAHTTVTAGSVIGWVGHTGNVQPNGPGGAHLHFGVRDTTQNPQNCNFGYVDPEPYLRGAQDN